MQAPQQLSYDDSRDFDCLRDSRKKEANQVLPSLLKNLGDAERVGTGNRNSDGQQRGITRDIAGGAGYICLFDDDVFASASELILNIRHGKGYDERGFGDNAENIRTLLNLVTESIPRFEAMSGSLAYDKGCVITSFRAIQVASQALLDWYHQYIHST